MTALEQARDGRPPAVASRWLTPADFPEERRLGFLLGELLAGLRDGDGLALGPREQAAAFAAASTLLQESATDAGQEFVASRERVERLRSWLAPIVARTAEDRLKLDKRFALVFRDASPETGLFLGDEAWDAAGRAEAVAPPPKSQMALRRMTLIATGLALALLAAFLVSKYWPAPQTEKPTPIIEQRPTRNRNAAPQAPSASPATAVQTLSRADIDGFALRIVQAAGPDGRATLYEIVCRLGACTQPEVGERYRLLTLYTQLSPEIEHDIGDGKILTRLTAALIHIEKPGSSFSLADLEAASSAGAPLAADNRNPDPDPPRAPLPPGAWVIPWWLLAILALGATSPFGLWLRHQSERKRAYLRRALEDVERDEVRRLEVKGDAVREMGKAARSLAEAARHLNARLREPTRALDTDATVLASIARAGRFTPVYAARRSRPEHLVLIQTAGPNDHQAERLSWLVEELISHEVPIERWYIEHNADRAFKARGDRRITLAELNRRYPGHRLIVLSTGDLFLDPATLEPWGWADAVRSWEARALVTPVPVAEWSRREAILARLFDAPLQEARAEGFVMLGERLRRESAPEDGPVAGRGGGRPVRSWRFDPRRFLIEAPADEDREWSLLDGDLSSYLDAPGREWLRAAAVYPSLRWDLTLYLGLKLTGAEAGPGKGRPLYSEERSVRLCLLPWFRTGHMPEWVRRRLIAEIGRKQRKDITRLIAELLAKADDLDPGRGVIKLPIAVRSAASGAGKRQHQPDYAADDPLLLDFLAKEDTSSFEAPRALIERLLRPDLGFHSRASLGGLLPFAYAAAGLWLVPKTWAGALNLADVLPFALLSFALVTWPLARWLWRGGGKAAEGD